MSRRTHPVVLHVALSTPGEGVGNEWLEPVTDEVYGSLSKNGANA
ncbi:hypothetical protein [Streptomyces sp. NBC_00102]|nr:hypothetical protein [Streptomyces sp. NBC_00102]MCX5402293.1 hypothetical protein [Streptomyces sp. NBC_00102]